MFKVKRKIGWLKKFFIEKIDEIQLELRVKKIKLDGCDNIHHARKSIEEKLNKSSPIFFISTGRTGTKFIAELLKLCPRVKAYHEPEPTLMSVSSELYEANLSRENQGLIFKSVRYEKMLKHQLADFRYVESNQTLISLVDGILLNFPNAKVVFIVREPYCFAQSAYRKGWFANDSVWENNRIGHQDVSTMGQLKAIFNYWSTVNRVAIEKSALYGQCTIVKLEELTSDIEKLKEVMRFIKVEDIPLATLKKKVTVKVNENDISNWEHKGMRKTDDLPDFISFRKRNEDFFSTKIDPLATLLNYETRF